MGSLNADLTATESYLAAIKTSIEKLNDGNDIRRLMELQYLQSLEYYENNLDNRRKMK